VIQTKSGIVSGLLRKYVNVCVLFRRLLTV